MTFSSKKTAVWAACTLGLCGAVLFSAPADARRYKKKIVRPQVQQQTMMQTPQMTMGGDRYSDLTPAYQNAAAQNQPRLSRAARNAHASATTGVGGFSGFGGSGLVTQARQYVGASASQLGVPSSLWCADFLNLVLRKSGHQGTGSRMASSFASYGRRISGPQVGAIAVMSRGKRGGHVGIVSGIDASGNPIIISGNHGRRVAETAYPRGRVYAYVMPH